LALAGAAYKHLKLSEIRFIPCKLPVNKSKTIASAESRLDMLSIAIKSDKRFTLDTREIDRTTPSYMIETLQSLHHEITDETFCLILGMDAFLQFDHWQATQEILSLAHLYVNSRVGFNLDLSPTLSLLLKNHQTTNAQDLHQTTNGCILLGKDNLVNIASSELRELTTPYEMANVIPKEVLNYIQKHHLYKIK
jgi:nicotinate-nucleotide adenylyltransferase